MEDAGEDSVTRSLEAYLLWLFGFVMFTNGHGNTADKVLMPYAQEIAEGAAPAVWSWGSAVLAATYRGLCEACSKTDPRADLQGCPLLLTLWAYERFAIGRPLIDHAAYGPDLYGDGEDSSPTMGTLWVSGRRV